MLVVSCPECRKELKIKDDLAGKRIKCPGCGAMFLVPVPSAPAETAVSASPPAPSPTPAVEPVAGDADSAGGESKRGKRRSKKPKAKSKTPLIIGLVAAVALVACCCPVTALSTWYFGVHESSPSNRAAAKAGADNRPPVVLSPDDKGGRIGKDFNLKRPGATSKPATPNAGDPGPLRDAIVGKWLNGANVWTFQKDGRVEIDLGHTYKGTYQFVDADVIACKAEGKPNSEFDGKWQVAVNDAGLTIARPEQFSEARPVPRLTRDAPEQIEAARAKLPGKWVLTGNRPGLPKSLTFGANGTVEVDNFPKSFKGTYHFIDDAVVYFHAPAPGVGQSNSGLWRVVLEGDTLRFSAAAARQDLAAQYKKADAPPDRDRR
jgi:hypothetical protein